MSIARALAVLGTGLTGFSQGQDQARKQQRDDEEAAWRSKTRQRQETQWEREDKKYADEEAQRQADAKAGANVEPVPELAPDQQGPQAYNVGGTYMGDPDQAKAKAAELNQPGARMARVAAAQKDPMRAAQIQAQAGQAELSGMQLNAAKQAEAVKAFDDGIRRAATTWGGLTKFLSESKADGKDGALKFATKPGEKGQILLYPVGPDGTALDAGQAFPDNDEGRAMAAFMFARGTTPEQKMKHYADLRREGRDQQRIDAQSAREERVAKAAERSASAAERAATAKMAGPTASAPVWDDKADAFLRQRYTVADPVTGEVGVDGGGLQFAKQVALAQAMRNGGDTTTALGYAFEIDARIKQQAGGDPTKVAQMRQGLLQTLTAQPGPPAAAPAAPANPAARPAAKPKAAAPSMSAAVAPGPTDKTLAGIESEAQAQVLRLHQEAMAARAQLAAVAKSGDPVALARYAQIAQTALAARDKAAAERLGNGAEKFLATLPQ